MAECLDALFEEIPKDSRYHVELRAESYLSMPVFEVLERQGVGQVLTHNSTPHESLNKVSPNDVYAGRKDAIPKVRHEKLDLRTQKTVPFVDPTSSPNRHPSAN